MCCSTPILASLGVALCFCCGTSSAAFITLRLHMYFCLGKPQRLTACTPRRLFVPASEWRPYASPVCMVPSFGGLLVCHIAWLAHGDGRACVCWCVKDVRMMCLA